MQFKIAPQPDGITCGQTCLHGVYAYYGDTITLNQVIAEIPTLDYGGTLAVVLGVHALKRGYKVTLYSYNIQFFDPTWFGKIGMADKLSEQLDVKPHKRKLKFATKWALEFLQAGGIITHDTLNASLLRKYLKKNIPILTGLSSTYLYQCKRETNNGISDDVAGLPAGHFVVLTGYDRITRKIFVSDPYPNPGSSKHVYSEPIDRVIASILLGVVTYDANLLVIEK